MTIHYGGFMSLSVLHSYNYPYSNSTFFSQIPDNKALKEFLNMDLETLLSKGIPETIRIFLIACCERVIPLSSIQGTDNCYGDILKYLILLQGSWKLDKIQYENFIRLLLSGMSCFDLYPLGRFDKHLFQALMEKIVILYAEWVGKDKQIKIGDWEVLERSYAQETKIAYIIYRLKENKWGMDMLLNETMSREPAPSAIRLFPFHTKVLTSAIEAEEKEANKSEIAAILSKQIPEGHYFFSDQTRTAQIDQLGAFFSFSFDNKDKDFFNLGLQKDGTARPSGYLKSVDKKQLPTVCVNVIFYTGPLDFHHTSYINGTEFNFFIHPVTEKLMFDESHIFEKDHPMYQTALDFSQKVLEEVKSEQISKLIDVYSMLRTEVTCAIMKPQNEKEWKLLENQLLKDLEAHAKEQPEMILALVDLLETEVSDKEFNTHATDEEKEDLKSIGNEVDLSAETLLKVMKEQVQTSYKAIIKEEIEKIAPDNASKEIKIGGVPQISSAKKISKKAKQTFKNKKENPSTSNDNNKGLQKSQQSSFAPEEKEKIKSVMKGNPMTSNEFNKVAIKLLKKKLGSLANTIRETQKNAHPVLRFTRPDGKKGGLTLAIKHGSKDLVSQVQSQKRTLKDILEL